MAIGDNRIKITQGGTTYWVNPDTGRVFTSRRAPASQAVQGAYYNPASGNVFFAGATGPAPGQSPPATARDPRAIAAPAPAPIGPVDTGSGVEGVATPTTPQAPEQAEEQGEWVLIGTAEDGREIWQNTVTGAIEYREGKPKEEAFDNDLFALFRRTLEEFGLVGMDDFLKEAVKKGYGPDQFIIEMRRQPAYLANPLFAANMERAKRGEGFMPEGQVLAWATEVRRLTKQYGFTAPSDNYLAAGFGSGKSLAEVEHLLRVQKQVELYGPVFKGFAEQQLGVRLGDDDLFEIFDPERDTQEFDDALRAAMYRARPFTLGLGIRSEAEQRALEMLGVDPEEAFRRYEQVASNRPRFERLAQIEDMFTNNLPQDYGSFLTGVDNGVLVRALVFNDQEALAQLQDMAAREIARFNQQQAVLSTGTGQAVGLLSAAERQSF